MIRQPRFASVWKLALLSWLFADCDLSFPDLLFHRMHAEPEIRKEVRSQGWIPTGEWRLWP